MLKSPLAPYLIVVLCIFFYQNPSLAGEKKHLFTAPAISALSANFKERYDFTGDLPEGAKLITTSVSGYSYGTGKLVSENALGFSMYVSDVMFVRDFSFVAYSGFSDVWSFNGGIAFNIDEYGYIDIGNRQWASSKLGINPQQLALGRAFDTETWRSMAKFINPAADAGYITQQSSFLDYMFYMTPKISYYSSQLLDGSLQVGVSASLGGKPTDAIYLHDFAVTIVPSCSDCRDGGPQYVDLLSFGAVYNSQFGDISIGLDCGTSNLTGNLATNLSMGGKTKINTSVVGTVGIAASIGYMTSDPRISWYSDNTGYYFDVSILYDGQDNGQAVSLSLGYFQSGAFVSIEPNANLAIPANMANKTAAAVNMGARVIMAGIEVNFMPWLTPFAELGYYSSIGIKRDPTCQVVSSSNGPLLFLGLKTHFLN